MGKKVWQGTHCSDNINQNTEIVKQFFKFKGMNSIGKVVISKKYC